MNCNRAAAKAYAGKLIKKYFDPKKLEPIGRLQFFYHSPSSELPVRDVRDEQGHGYKTEPHLEENAENFRNECCQKTNIQGLLKCREEYLFLFTTCKSRSAELEKFYGERCIIGYLRVKRFLPRRGFIGVQGETRIVSFRGAYPLEMLDKNYRNIRVRRLSVEETKRVRNHLHRSKNIKGRCIGEIRRLEIGLRREEGGKCS